MDRVLNPPLHILNGVPGVALIPAPVEFFGNGTQLDNEIIREVLGHDLAALLAPEPNEASFIIAHNYPGIRTANESIPINQLRHEHLPIIANHPRGAAGTSGASGSWPENLDSGRAIKQKRLMEVQRPETKQ
jgi:hypothetical protein